MYGYIGPAQKIQDNLGVLTSVLLIALAKALLLCKIIYSQIPKIRAWASLEAISLPTIGCSVLLISVILVGMSLGVSHCSFNLLYPSEWGCWAYFHFFICHFYIFCIKCLFKMFPVFFLCLIFLLMSGKCSLHILNINLEQIICFRNIFPCLWLPF